MRGLKKAFLALVLLALLPATAWANFTATGTIASGASLSGVIDLRPFVQKGNQRAVAIIMPAAWTTAGITLQGSADCTSYFNVFIQAGTEYTVTTPLASEYIVLTPNDLVGMNCLKIRSGTSGSPVVQGADRIMTVVLNK